NDGTGRFSEVPIETTGMPANGQIPEGRWAYGGYNHLTGIGATQEPAPAGALALRTTSADDGGIGDTDSDGSDTDTLALSGKGIHLDLGQIDLSAFAGIETIDISGTGPNSLSLTEEDLQGLLEDADAD